MKVKHEFFKKFFSSFHKMFILDLSASVSYSVLNTDAFNTWFKSFLFQPSSSYHHLISQHNKSVNIHNLCFQILHLHCITIIKFPTFSVICLYVYKGKKYRSVEKLSEILQLMFHVFMCCQIGMKFCIAVFIFLLSSPEYVIEPINISLTNNNSLYSLIPQLVLLSSVVLVWSMVLSCEMVGQNSNVDWIKPVITTDSWSLYCKGMMHSTLHYIASKCHIQKHVTVQYRVSCLVILIFGTSYAVFNCHTFQWL